MQRFRREHLSGWGRFTWEESAVYRPERPRAVARILQGGGTYIARGLGRSYGDSALAGGGGVIDCTRLDRMLDFDERTGTLRAEAGLSIDEVVRTFLPRGFFPPVTPGTRFVTLGGAIAHDVHGKNHHVDGSFGRFVQALDLLLPSGEVLRCSRQENAEVFRATLGGAGLTGVILSAQIELLRVPSAWIRLERRRVENLEQALEVMTASDRDYRYSVAWIDCLAGGRRLGRAVLLRGDHAPAEGPLRSRPFAVPDGRTGRIPFDFPSCALNRFTIRAANACFYARSGDLRDRLVSYRDYFYPLDGIRDWNRMYGRRGFVQYQAAFPTASSAAGLKALLERLSASGRASFLAVLKRLGPAGEGMLSFPLEGFTLALDIPAGRGLLPFLGELEAITREHGGRLYLAKDATAGPEALWEMYPRLARFREVRRRLDPGNRLISTQARRLGIVENDER